MYAAIRISLWLLKTGHIDDADIVNNVLYISRANGGSLWLTDSLLAVENGVVASMVAPYLNFSWSSGLLCPTGLLTVVSVWSVGII